VGPFCTSSEIIEDMKVQSSKLNNSANCAVVGDTVESHSEELPIIPGIEVDCSKISNILSMVPAPVLFAVINCTFSIFDYNVLIVYS